MHFLTIYITYVSFVESADDLKPNLFVLIKFVVTIGKKEETAMPIPFLNCYNNKNQNKEILYFIFGYQSSADATKDPNLNMNS